MGLWAMGYGAMVHMLGLYDFMCKRQIPSPLGHWALGPWDAPDPYRRAIVAPFYRRQTGGLTNQKANIHTYTICCISLIQ